MVGQQQSSLKRLLNHPQDYSTIDGNNILYLKLIPQFDYTPLSCAAQHGHDSIIEILLQYGAKEDRKVMTIQAWLLLTTTCLCLQGIFLLVYFYCSYTDW